MPTIPSPTTRIVLPECGDICGMPVAPEESQPGVPPVAAAVLTSADMLPVMAASEVGGMEERMSRQRCSSC